MYFPGKQTILISTTLTLMLLGGFALSAKKPASSKSGRVFYISASKGNDKNDGRSPNKAGKRKGPWASLKNLKSGSVLKPGDKILFRRSDKWRNLKGIRLRATGAPGRPLVFGAYGKGRASVIHTDSRPAFLYLSDYGKTVSDVVIENLNLRGNGKNRAIFLAHDKKNGDTRRITIRNNRFSGFGIALQSQAQEDVLVENNKFISNKEFAILGGVLGKNLTIRKNVIRDSGQGCKRRKDKYCHNIYLSKGTNVLIEANDISKATNYGILIHGKLTNLTIRGNRIYNNNHAIAVDPGYRKLPEIFKNVVIENNLIYNHKGVWVLSFNSIHGLKFRNNRVLNFPRGTINVRRPSRGDASFKDAVFENNMFYNTNKLIHADSNAVMKNVRALNNIVVCKRIKKCGGVGKIVKKKNRFLSMDKGKKLLKADEHNLLSLD